MKSKIKTLNNTQIAVLYNISDIFFTSLLIRLGFQAATLPEFKKTLITDENASALLPVSAIYGPNGGGKTNLLMALSCVISTIVIPVSELKKGHTFPILQQNANATPFAFDTVSSEEPTEFRFFSVLAKMNTVTIFLF